MFTLPELGYSYDALAPYIDKETMQIHHTKHHQAYVNNLNAALEKHPQYQEWTLDQLLEKINQVPEDIRAAIQNNGGGHSNHSLFWTYMKPGGGKLVGGDLEQEIVKKFGSFQQFQEIFNQAAKTRFGSGWAWLVLNHAGGIEVYSTPNQDSPLMEGKKPLLGLDVWEHAYYLHYQNRRPDYISAWWNVIDWDKVEQDYRLLIGKE